MKPNYTPNEAKIHHQRNEDTHQNWVFFVIEDTHGR